ncbi:DUF6678 family protein [Paenibacillus sp. USHLN196]|uniref:DUF6678 family protein n=1 Tax=Paenibacillus sp. USHLN196 TaxID=3081291 RepID=UPI0030158E80
MPMNANLHKQKVMKEVQLRHLVSSMNNTKWIALLDAIYDELPFCPPFQIKTVLEQGPYPETFEEEEVTYLGDWLSLQPGLYNVEWVRVKPRMIKPIGRYVEPEVLDIEAEWVALLQRLRIPYIVKHHDYWIYGYATAAEFDQLV